MEGPAICSKCEGLLDNDPAIDGAYIDNDEGQGLVVCGECVDEERNGDQ